MNCDNIDTFTKLIYEYYHKKYMMHRCNTYVKKIVNWDNIELKPDWIYFKRLANIVNKSSGQINYKLYIDSLFDYFDGKFSTKLIGSQKSLGIYKQYINELNEFSDETKVYNNIIHSIKFIVKYCKEHNIKSFDDYFYLNNSTFPTIVLQYNSGVINAALFCLIPNIILRLQSFPGDVVKDYFNHDTINKIIANRILILNMNEKIKYIANNFLKVLNNAINT